MREAVWIEITDDVELGFNPVGMTGGSVEANVVGLYRKNSQICALVAPKSSEAGAAGFGNSVHEAIHQLADRLVAQGLWIEVTERREWRLEPMDPTDGLLTELPHAAWGSPSCRGFLNAVKHGDSAQLVCGECGDLAYVGEASTLDATITRMKHTRLTTMPHASFGAPDCCGCLNAVARGDEVDIICGECGAIAHTVPAGDVELVLIEMELTLAVLSEPCPHCQTVEHTDRVLSNHGIYLSELRRGCQTF